MSEMRGKKQRAQTRKTKKRCRKLESQKGDRKKSKMEYRTERTESRKKMRKRKEEGRKTKTLIRLNYEVYDKHDSDLVMIAAQVLAALTVVGPIPP